MAKVLSGIIDQLERRKKAIERALTALRQIEGIATPTTATEIKSPAEALKLTRRKFSAASRRKMALAQQVRWAKVKGVIEPPLPLTPESPKPKRRISAEGMKRIIAATKKRWRLQKAAARATAA